MTDMARDRLSDETLMRARIAGATVEELAHCYEMTAADVERRCLAIYPQDRKWMNQEAEGRGLIYYARRARMKEAA